MGQPTVQMWKLKIINSKFFESRRVTRHEVGYREDSTLSNTDIDIEELVNNLNNPPEELQDSPVVLR